VARRIGQERCSTLAEWIAVVHLTAGIVLIATGNWKSNRAAPDLGFSREPAAAVADAIATGTFDVIRHFKFLAKT
jgi:hypothetical protein